MRWSRAASAVILVGCLVWAPVAQAQKSTLLNGAGEIRKDRFWWASQLRQARETGGRTLQELQAAPPDDSEPVDETMLQNARNTYILIRSARAGMEIYKSEQRFPDPLLDLMFQNVTEAWTRARTPVDKATWRMPRDEYLSVSILDLARSLRLLDQTLVLLP